MRIAHDCKNNKGHWIMENKKSLEANSNSDRRQKRGLLGFQAAQC